MKTDDWINHLADMPTCRPQTIVDGVRIRNIKVAIGAGDTKLLTRAEQESVARPIAI